MMGFTTRWFRGLRRLSWRLNVMVVEDADDVDRSRAKPGKLTTRVGRVQRFAARVLLLAVVGAAIVDAGLLLAYHLALPPARPTEAHGQSVGDPGSAERADVAKGKAAPIEEDISPYDRFRVVPREKRWRFEFPSDQTESDYARFLDLFNIELATPAGSGDLTYASHFTGTPIHRTAPGREETRMYTSWSTLAHKQFDCALLRKAGVKVSDTAIVIQLLPPKVVDNLSRLEYAYGKRHPRMIRRTRFKVISSGKTFDFLVIAQQHLDPTPDPE